MCCDVAWRGVGYTYEKQKDLMVLESANEADEWDGEQERAAEYETADDVCRNDARRLGIGGHRYQGYR